MVSIHDKSGLDNLLRAAGLRPQQIHRIRTNFLKHFEGAGRSLRGIDDGLRRELMSSIDFHPLELEERLDSRVDGASRLLFKQASGLLLESVILRIATGRCSLCVSCQVGCAAGCRFCATGQMRQAVDLTAHEIVDQLVQANAILKPDNQRVRNIVFMGMGEPFHNEEEVVKAIELLTDSSGIHHPAMKILVSTVGVPDAMTRFARAFPDVNLALSLHSVDAGIRESVIPIARRIALSDIREAVAEVESLRGGRSMMIEYLLLRGVNDSDEQISALAEWLEGLNVHINLIPFNPGGDDDSLQPTPRARREEIAEDLKARGFLCTLRYSLGADIAAACDQLVSKRNRSLITGP